MNEEAIGINPKRTQYHSGRIFLYTPTQVTFSAAYPFGISLKTTNCLESINAQVGRFIGKAGIGETAIRSIDG